jgi:hypothetical protein
MALIDVQATFADRQAVTVTAFGANFYDTGTVKRNLGRTGERVRFTANSTVTGTGTVAFEVVGADNADGSGNTTIMASSAAIPIATLNTQQATGTGGFDVVMPDNTQRYVGVRFTVAGGPLTGGTFSANVIGDGGSSFQRNYPTAYPSPYSG